jgi:YggT family protein
MTPNVLRMGDLLATFGLLGDTATSIQSFVEVFIYVYILLIFAYVILSWIRAPYSPTLSRVQRFLYDVCDPYLRLFRRILPTLGPLDLSPIVAIFALILIQRLLDALIQRIF